MMLEAFHFGSNDVWLTNSFLEGFWEHQTTMREMISNGHGWGEMNSRWWNCCLMNTRNPSLKGPSSTKDLWHFRSGRWYSRIATRRETEGKQGMATFGAHFFGNSLETVSILILRYPKVDPVDPVTSMAQTILTPPQYGHQPIHASSEDNLQLMEDSEEFLPTKIRFGVWGWWFRRRSVYMYIYICI